MLRPALIGGDERKVDVGGLRSAQFHLCLLARFLQTLQRHWILGEIDRLIALEFGYQPVDDALIEVVSTEVGITIGGLHLELTGSFDIVKLEDRDVIGSTTEVEHRDFLILLLVESVSERGRCWLIDNPQHVEAGDLAGVLGRLALRVVEVRRHRDDRLLDLVAEVVFSGLLHLLKDHRRDLRR